MTTEHVFKIPVFSGLVALVLICVLALAIPSLVKGLHVSTGIVQFIVLSTSTIILLCAIAIILSFKHAIVSVDEKFLQFSSGFRTVSLALDKIERTAIIDKSEFPMISYKIWAYAILSQKNGIFRMADNRKAYIAGTAEKYWAVHFIDVDIYIALNEDNDSLIRFVNEFVASYWQKK